ncbi:MAG TPA: HAMP domain-containing sensor histidine kinase [Caulobacteraceae bacterium]|jgi:signal transduction histidine kinase
MSRKWKRFSWPGGLSARLLLLTVLFVVVAQVFLLVPSLADYQENWLNDRLRAAEVASVAVEAIPEQTLTDQTASQLLEGAGVVSVAIRSEGVRRLLLVAPRMRETPRFIDLRRRNPQQRLLSPFRTLLRGDGHMLRVIDRPRFRSGDFVEIVVPETPLRRELKTYLLSILGVTAFISVVTGGLVYLSLTLFLVRPMRRITASMERFRADPDDPAARVALSGRHDEVGRAETELSRMQNDLRAALHSKARLAALGEAVAKINHDLRNMLTSAQIASERMAKSGDPQVAQALPRLERALDRAIGLAQNVLTYGKSQEPPPSPQTLPLAAAVEAAAEDAGLAPEGVALLDQIPPRLAVRVDPEHLHRVLVNLLRNAREAIETTGRSQGRVTVTAERDEGVAVIHLADDGPGVPEKAQPRLFQPFAVSGRQGGAGLGLAIARELAQSNGGDVRLADSGPQGATFELRLPAA